jgi:HEAT repeat protein
MPTRTEIEELLRNPHASDDELRALGAGAVPTLVEILHAEHEGWADDLLRASLRALGVLATQKAVAALIAASEDPSVPAWLQRAALRELGSSDRREVVDHLREMLNGGDLAVAKSAAAALILSPRPEARAALEEARIGALPELERIIAERLGESPPPTGPRQDI